MLTPVPVLTKLKEKVVIIERRRKKPEQFLVLRKLVGLN